jgi:hypothetical protein
MIWYDGMMVWYGKRDEQEVSVHGVCVTNGLPSHLEPSVHIDAHSERTAASVWGVHTIGMNEDTFGQALT